MITKMTELPRLIWRDELATPSDQQQSPRGKADPFQYLRLICLRNERNVIA